MSHDAPHATGPHGDAPASDAEAPAVQDAHRVLLIMLASIVVFSAIVHLFVF